MTSSPEGKRTAVDHAVELAGQLDTATHRESGSAVEQLRDLAALLRREDKVERRILAGVIREARRRRRSGDRAFSDAVTGALLVESLIWLREGQEQIAALASSTRSVLEEARDGVARVYDEEIGPEIERGMLAQLKKLDASKKGAAANKAKADRYREMLLRGETVHLSDRQKRRLLNGK